MTGPASTPEPTPEPVPKPGPLPRREPRTPFVHFAIDTAVAFLAMVMVLLILDVSFWVILGLAVVIGAIAAPYTRRAEERALARRYEAGPGSPAA